MQAIWQDLRYAARMLFKQPGFTLVAIVTLALGIGANTAIFSVVNTVLLEPLPFKESDRLVMVWESRHGPSPRPTNTISMANFLDWRDQNQSFGQMAAFYDARINLTGVEDPEEVPIQIAMPEFFSLLGVEPLFGRPFNTEDVKDGAEDVVLISHGLWQRRFGSDSNVIGKKLLLNGRPQTVVGVMPPGFHFLIQEWSLTKQKADIWSPWRTTPNMRVRGGRFASAVARLKPGVTLAQAQADLSAIAAGFEKQYPDFNTNWGVNLVPLRKQFSGEIRTPLLILLGAVGFVLLIGCANVANLLLARAAARQRELAIRTALGAGRWRVVRQLLTESVLLAGAGGTLGVLLAIWGLDVLLSLSPTGLLPAEGVRLDWTVLGFTLGLSVLTGLLFGLAPAFHAARVDMIGSLKEGGRGTGAGLRASRSRSVLVMGEVALALVLLIGAGLLVRSLILLRGVPPGFNAENVLTARVVLPGSKYREDHQRIAFFQDLVARFGTLPDVRSAGAVNFLPLTGPGAATRIVIEGRPVPERGQEPVADVRVVHPNYFRTMGIPLLKGRNFSEQEAREMKHVVIINEAMAREHWPNEDPIGKRVTIKMKDEDVPSEIIGVVGDVRHFGLNLPIRSMTYWPHPELAYNFMTVVVRTESDPRRLAPLMQQIVRSLDPDQPVASVMPMTELIRDSLARQRFSTVLLGVFAGVAMLLAAVGIYGVMAYSVAQRTREMGIRMALGAQAGAVLGLVIRQGMAVVLAGVATGIGAALGLTRFMESELFGVKRLDFATFAVVPVLLLAVALIACLVPALRATRVDPMTALRYE